MTTTAILLGLDSIEPALVDRWADEGLLPTFDWLRRTGATSDLESPFPGLAGGVWPEVNHGTSSGKLGRWNVLADYSLSEESLARTRRIDEEATRNQFWLAASAAGRRVAMIDSVYATLDAGSQARQLAKWGMHDFPTVAAESSPADWVPAIREGYGEYPVNDCDWIHGATEAGYLRLTRQLEAAAEMKASLITDLLEGSDWDLMAATFTEGHCAGHQMWHLVDPIDGRNSEASREEMRTMLRVYRALDTAVGRVIESAGSDALIMVVALKGMGPHLGGPQLVPGVLHALGLGPKRRLRRRAWDHVPRSVKSRLRAVLPEQIRKSALVGAEPSFVDGSQAMYIRSDQDAAVRLNLIGREAAGVVKPGAEADRIIDRLRDEFLALRHPQRPGEAIVERVIITDEEWDPGRVDQIPEMIVEFRRDLGVLEGCVSDSVGSVRAPMTETRTGNHTGHHRLWAIGPGVMAGTGLEAYTTDVGPTLLSRLGVSIPVGIDGSPIRDLGRSPRFRSPGTE